MAEHTRVMLLSIRPSHADNILAGLKRVELRRMKPHIVEGQLVALYASSPTRGIVGVGRAASVHTANVRELKDAHLSESAVSEPEFDDYFEGAGCAVAIRLTDFFRLESPVALEELRSAGLPPTQSWRYIAPESLLSLLGAARDRRRVLALSRAVST